MAEPSSVAGADIPSPVIGQEAAKPPDVLQEEGPSGPPSLTKKMGAAKPPTDSKSAEAMGARAASGHEGQAPDGLSPVRRGDQIVLHVVLVSSLRPDYVLCWKDGRRVSMRSLSSAGSAVDDALLVLQPQLQKIWRDVPECVNEQLLRAVAAAPVGMGETASPDGRVRHRVWAVLVDDEAFAAQPGLSEQPSMAKGAPAWRPYKQLAADVLSASWAMPEGGGPPLVNAYDLALLSLWRACSPRAPVAAVACARSGVMLRALLAVGLDATSYDTAECESQELAARHVVGDLFVDGFKPGAIDLLVGSPSCQLLSNAGARYLFWGKGDPDERYRNMQESAAEFRWLLHYPATFRCLENSKMHRFGKAEVGRGPSFMVHPHEHGHNETKPMGWYEGGGVPDLRPTRPVLGRAHKRAELWPSATRAIDRARAYSGVSAAIAVQHGGLAWRTVAMEAHGLSADPGVSPRAVMPPLPTCLPQLYVESAAVASRPIGALSEGGGFSLLDDLVDEMVGSLREVAALLPTLVPGALTPQAALSGLRAVGVHAARVRLVAGGAPAVAGEGESADPLSERQYLALLRLGSIDDRAAHPDVYQDEGRWASRPGGCRYRFRVLKVAIVQSYGQQLKCLSYARPSGLLDVLGARCAPFLPAAEALSALLHDRLGDVPPALLACVRSGGRAAPDGQVSAVIYDKWGHAHYVQLWRVNYPADLPGMALALKESSTHPSVHGSLLMRDAALMADSLELSGLLGARLLLTPATTTFGEVAAPVCVRESGTGRSVAGPASLAEARKVADAPFEFDPAAERASELYDGAAAMTRPAPPDTSDQIRVKSLRFRYGKWAALMIRDDGRYAWRQLSSAHSSAIESAVGASAAAQQATTLSWGEVSSATFPAALPQHEAGSAAFSWGDSPSPPTSSTDHHRAAARIQQLWRDGLLHRLRLSAVLTIQRWARRRAHQWYQGVLAYRRDVRRRALFGLRLRILDSRRRRLPSLARELAGDRASAVAVDGYGMPVPGDATPAAPLPPPPRRHAFSRLATAVSAVVPEPWSTPPSRAPTPAPDISPSEVFDTPMLPERARCAYFASLHVCAYARSSKGTSTRYRVRPAGLAIATSMADCGAAPSCIGSDLLASLPGDAVVDWLPAPTEVQPELTTAVGGTVLLLGHVTIVFSIDGYAYRHRFKVVEGGDLMLVGNDFLVAHGAVVDLASGVCRLPHPKAEGGWFAARLALFTAGGQRAASAVVPAESWSGQRSPPRRRKLKHAARAGTPSGAVGGTGVHAVRTAEAPSDIRYRAVRQQGEIYISPRSTAGPLVETASEAEMKEPADWERWADVRARMVQLNQPTAALDSAMEQTGLSSIETSEVSDTFQYRNHILYASKPIVVKGLSEKDIMVNLPHSMRGKEGVLLVDRLPERPGYDKVLAAMSLSRIQGDQIRVRVINPSKTDVVIRELQPLAQLRYDYEAHDDEPKFTLDEISEKQLELLRQINLDPQHLLTPEQKAQVNATLKRMVAAFAENPKSPHITHVLEARIDFKAGLTPPKHRPARQSSMAQALIDEHVENLMKNDQIEESVGPYACRLVLVSKKDETSPTGKATRCCLDFRDVNEVLASQGQDLPLPRCDDVIDFVSSVYDRNGRPTTPQWWHTMDLASGFFGIPLVPEHRERASFVTARGQYQYKVLPFGLSHAPVLQQRVAEAVMAGLVWTRCACYLDDCVAPALDFEDGLERLELILERYIGANLSLKASKAWLFCAECIILGSMVSRAGVQPDPAKLEAVKAIRAEDINSVHAIQQFLGLAGYYRKHIKDFSIIARPLQELTCAGAGDVAVESQRPECKAAVEKLKLALLTSPILAMPRADRPFYVKTDAAHKHGVGGVLTQLDDDGKTERPVAYYGRTLKKHERNYTVTEVELLAGVEAIKAWRCYLWGKHFYLITDHHALQWLSTLRDAIDGGPASRLVRWSLRLQEYDFTVIHKKGRLHDDADAISRLTSREGPDEPAEDETDPEVLATLRDQAPTAYEARTTPFGIPRRKIQAALADMRAYPPLARDPLPWESALNPKQPPEYFAEAEPEEPVAAMEVRAPSGNRGNRSKFHAVPPRDATRKCLADLYAAACKSDPDLPVMRQAQKEDDFCNKMASFLLTGALPESIEFKEATRLAVNSRLFTVRDGLLHRVARHSVAGAYLQLVVPATLTPAYLEAFHDGMGHQGPARTLHLLRQRVWWPFMDREVRAHVTGCHECLFGKAHRAERSDSQMPQVGIYPFQVVMADVLSLPASEEGHCRLLCFVDSLSRWPEAVALKRDPTAAEFTDAYLDLVVSRHGVPAALVSDRGPNLIGDPAEKLLRGMGTTPSPGAAHLHRAAALVERLQQTITELIRTNHPGGAHWQVYLPFVLFVLRSTTSRGHDLSPSFVLSGRELRLPGAVAASDDALMEVARARKPRAPLPPEPAVPPALARLRAVWNTALSNTRASQEDGKSRLDGRRKEQIKFDPNDQVLLRLPPGTANKLEWNWTGPYRIGGAMENGNYSLKDADLPRGVANKFHESQLRWYPAALEGGDLADDEYLIDSITDRRVLPDGQLEYEVVWVGRGGRRFNAQWTPVENLLARNADLLREYDEANLPVVQPAPRRGPGRPRSKPPAMEPAQRVPANPTPLPVDEPPGPGPELAASTSDPVAGRSIRGLWHYVIQGGGRGRRGHAAQERLVPARNYPLEVQQGFAARGFGPPGLATAAQAVSPVAVVTLRSRPAAKATATRSLPCVPESLHGEEALLLVPSGRRVEPVLERRWRPGMGEEAKGFLRGLVPDWMLVNGRQPMVVTYDYDEMRGWVPRTVAAESAVLFSMGHSQMGLWSLRPMQHEDELGVYEGREKGAHRTQAQAAAAALRVRSRHLITLQDSDDCWAVVDGAAARPGGVQRVNDVRGTGRQPDVVIRADGKVTVCSADGILPLVHSSSWAEAWEREVLTDYGARFWEARDPVSVVMTDASQHSTEPGLRLMLERRAAFRGAVEALGEGNLRPDACATALKFLAAQHGVQQVTEVTLKALRAAVTSYVQPSQSWDALCLLTGTSRPNLIAWRGILRASSAPAGGTMLRLRGKGQDEAEGPPPSDAYASALSAVRRGATGMALHIPLRQLSRSLHVEPKMSSYKAITAVLSMRDGRHETDEEAWVAHGAKQSNYYLWKRSIEDALPSGASFAPGAVATPRSSEARGPTQALECLADVAATAELLAT